MEISRLNNGQSMDRDWFMANHVHQAGNDTHLQFKDGVMVLVGVDRCTLGTDDFVFLASRPGGPRSWRPGSNPGRYRMFGVWRPVPSTDRIDHQSAVRGG